MEYLHLLVVATVLPLTWSSCVESSISIFITAEGHIRGKFVGLEDVEASQMVTTCGMKCFCFGDVFQCCSAIDCIQMERKCNTEHKTDDIPNETIKFEPNGHHPVPKRSILLERVLSGRAAAMRRDRRDADGHVTTLEATTATAAATTEPEHSHEVTNMGYASTEPETTQKEGGNLVQSAVDYAGRRKRSAGDVEIRVKREQEEYMEDIIITTTMEPNGGSTDAPGKHKSDRKKRSPGSLAVAEHLEREKRNVPDAIVRVKRDTEEFMEDVIVTTTMASQSEATDAPRKDGSDRKKRSSHDANLADCGDEKRVRSKQNAGEEMVRVKRDTEEFMEDVIVTTTMASPSESTDAPRKPGSDRKKREVLEEIVLTTETASTEHTEVEVDFVTNVVTTPGYNR